MRDWWRFWLAVAEWIEHHHRHRRHHRHHHRKHHLSFITLTLKEEDV
jgi:hypothetical protein